MDSKRTYKNAGPMDHHTEYFDNLKLPVYDDIEKGLFFFGEQNNLFKPEYLELPIKIETYHPSEPHKGDQSQSLSDSIEHQNAMIYEEMGESNGQQPFNQDLMFRSNLDIIDEILLPFEQLRAKSDFSSEHISLIEVENVSHQQCKIKEEQMNCLEKEKSNLNQLKQLQSSRKQALALISSFHTFSQSLQITMNYHRLAKKDSLNRVYESVLTLLSKQNKKMKAALTQELLENSNKLKEYAQRSKVSPWLCEPAPKLEMTKQLFSTMAGDDKGAVKLECDEGQI